MADTNVLHRLDDGRPQVVYFGELVLTLSRDGRGGYEVMLEGEDTAPVPVKVTTPTVGETLEVVL